MKLLLVDGSEGDIRLIESEEVSHRHDAIVVEAVRAKMTDAVAVAARELPDVALVGVGVSDLDALSALIAAVPHLPVLALTDTRDRAFAREAVMRGAQDCIARSHANRADLLQALDLSILRKRIQRGELDRITLDAARLYQCAEDATRSRDEVIGIIAHDLRNPLNVITMTMALFAEDEFEEEKRAKHMKKLDRATERMVLLIDELVDISRLDAKRLQIEPEIRGVAQLVEEALASSRPAATEKSLRTESSVEEDAKVYADPPRVVQVLTVLLEQAASMAPKNGVIKVAAANDGGVVRFTVEVPGAAIAAEHVPRVYDRFWSKKHGGRDGTGLSLAIAKGLVEAHGGEISAESGASGTSFAFTLCSEKPA